MTRRVLLLAPHGQVGFELQHMLPVIGQLYTLSRAQVDFSDTAETIRFLSKIDPDVIVNAAAWTKVDDAETNPAAAYSMNYELPKALALWSAERSKVRTCWLVHYSSDYVYSGEGDAAWFEHDEAKPRSVYGASKLAGDQAIADIAGHFLIFRTSWIYAARGHNFMNTMLKLAEHRQSLNVVSDQMGAPTPARLVANVTVLVLQQVLQSQPINLKEQSRHPYSGVYHVATRGVTHWYEFAATIFAAARSAGVPLLLSNEQLRPVLSCDYITPAKRPLNSRLNLQKLENTFSLSMPDWQAQFQEIFLEWLSMYQRSKSDKTHC